MPELPVFVYSPLVGLAFAAGLLVAAGLVTGLHVIRRRGRLCPRCGSTTVALVPSFPLNLLRGRVLSRWCSGCDWKGLARRPSHEMRALDGRIHLRGGFRWGSAAPPRPFFHWSHEAEAELSPEPLPPPPLPFQWRGGPPPAGLDGPPPPIPFSWGHSASDGPPQPPAIPFRFAGDEPFPLPFRFAHEEERDHTADLPEPEEPPHIPFHFADEEDPHRRSVDPRASRPRLGFRWKG